MRRRTAWDDDAEDADRREHEAPRVREREAGSSRSIRLRSWDDAREGSAEHGEATASDDVREGLADDAASSGSDFEIVDPDPQQDFCEEMMFLLSGTRRQRQPILHGDVPCRKGGQRGCR